jgi:DNA helicase-2/ATP-dependent DNA helicase PcrA
MQAARLVGGAGTGKTRSMIETMEKALARPGVGPFSIGFASFTRAAADEAAARASAVCGLPAAELRETGWFRTLHGLAYRAVGGRNVIGGKKEDIEWVSEAVGGGLTRRIKDSGSVELYEGDAEARIAINAWGIARTTLRRLEDVLAAVDSPECPPFHRALKRIQMYEAKKASDDRIDFTDLLQMFAGAGNDPETGPFRTTPQGQPPAGVTGWIFDEAQDASALIDLCCKRVVDTDACKWVWLTGDPFQAIYSWAGADSRYFMDWDVGDRQKVMPKSYRCAAPILALGERCLERLSRGYWDRKIAPADHDGEVAEAYDIANELYGLDPRVSTLVLARTNLQCKSLAAIMHEAGVPFRYTKSDDDPLVFDEGMMALWSLQKGEFVDGAAFGRALELIPVAGNLNRGAKAKWGRGPLESVHFDDLPAVGATPAFIEKVRSGTWPTLVNNGTRWLSNAKKWGAETTSRPRIRLGTIHSAKGAEADKVVLLSSLGFKSWESEQTNVAAADEGRRLTYVGVTRARRELVVAHSPSERYRMEIPL